MSENIFFKINLKCLNETNKLAANLAQLLEPGTVIGLQGQLGAGKTHFTKALGAGLKIPGDCPITSPTFTIINDYDGRFKLYHADLYRIYDISEIDETGLTEYFYSEAVSIVEWADKFPEIFPEDYIKIAISITGENSRVFLIEATGKKSEFIVSKLKKIYANRLLRNG